MDFHCSESTYIDSLDFLSPPVKRLLTNREVFFGSYNRESNNVHVLRKYRNKFTKTSQDIPKPNRKLKTGVTPSKSLIIKKTSERQILERYSVVSYTSLHVEPSCTSTQSDTKTQDSGNKPVIKVTVIPKSDPIQTAKLLRKRRQIPKRVHSSLSNQDNSVHAENLYLIVAGRRKDKIYEIKTTGSATLFKDEQNSNLNKNETISIEGLRSVKNLIQSLNMDQNKKKDRSNFKSDGPQHASFVDTGSHPYDTEKCVCPDTMTSIEKPSNRSRVRIYGQLGLTQDDRYVLRYGATVNNKPVSDFAQLTSTFSPDLIPLVACSPPCHDTQEDKKDAVVQASSEREYKNHQSPAPNFSFGGESQGTQVNFNVQVSSGRDIRSLTTSDKDIQCNCCKIVEKRLTENKVAETGLNDCQSPLVIISVYPKSSPDDFVNTDKSASENKRNTSPPRTHAANAQCSPPPKLNKGTDKRMTESKADSNRDKKSLEVKKDISGRRLTGRPVTPIKKPSKPKMQEKQIETRVPKTQVDKKSPDRYKAMRVIKNKILEKDKRKPDVNTPSPGTSKFTAPGSRQGLRSQETSRRPSRLHEKGTNTEHAKAKKVLVDSYTKKLTEQWSRKDTIPAKLENSKVTVNIDGENEYFNLLFDQGTLTTDLRIRKTMKDMASQQGCGGNLSASLENLLLYAEREDIQPASIPLFNKQYDKTPNNERVSGITIRDSLEISHRREDKIYGNVKNSQSCYTAHCIEDFTDDTGFLAPIKHYTGDDCSISDPVERDRQIRELLGVDKSKAYSSDKDDYLSHCYHQRKCMKSQVTDINSVNLSPCLHVPDKMKKATKKANHSSDANDIPQEVSHVANFCNINAQFTNTGQTYIEPHYNQPKTEGKYYPSFPRHFQKVQPQLGISQMTPEQVSLPYPNAPQLNNCKAAPLINVNAAPFNNCKTIPFTNTNATVDSNTNVAPLWNGNVALHSNTNAVPIPINNAALFTNNYAAPLTNNYVRTVTNVGTVANRSCCCNLLYNSQNAYQQNNLPGYGNSCYYDSEGNLKSYININEDGVRNGDEASAIQGNVDDFYQQLILNRNIQVFLQVEQFSKQRPIILSRKQYDKVKKTIQTTLLKKFSREKRIKSTEKMLTSEVSVGKVRRKTTIEIMQHCDQGVQTDSTVNQHTPSNQRIYRQARLLKVKYLTKSLKPSRIRDIQQSRKYEKGSEADEIHQLNTSQDKLIGHYNASLDRKKRKCEKRNEWDKCYQYNDGRYKRNDQYCGLQEEHYRRNSEQHRRIGEYPMESSYCSRPGSECHGSYYEHYRTGEEHYRDGRLHHRSGGERYKSSGHYHKEFEETGPVSEAHQRPREEHHQVNEHTAKGHYRTSEQQKITAEHPRICGKLYNSNEEYEAVRAEHLKIMDVLARTNKEYCSSYGDRQKVKGEHQNIISEEKHKICGGLEEESRQIIGDKKHKKCGEHHRVNEEHEKRTNEKVNYDQQKISSANEKVITVCDKNVGVYDESLREIARPKEKETHEKSAGQHGENLRYSEDHGRDSSDQQKHSRYTAEQQNKIRTPREKLKTGEDYGFGARTNIRKEPEIRSIVHDLHGRSSKESDASKDLEEKKQTVLLFQAKDKSNTEPEPTSFSKTKTMSSMEVHYTSVAYMKQVEMSSSDVTVVSDSSLEQVQSFRTIFRGHRKSATPNLGTSVYSLYSEDGLRSNKSAKYILAPQDTKTNKKPFLLRLMSCLVMRSARTSALKLPVSPAQDIPSVDSSFDSYHISTSLGAVEVSSSIYDTTASFYSNHTIQPIHSKMKRGFFNSVRGFLTNRRS